MKKIFILITFVITLNASLVSITVSIEPIVKLVKDIGGKYVEINAMVPRGSEPHEYSPKPTQLIKLSNSKVYFSIDAPFEKRWLEKLKAQNKAMKVIDISKGITKINSNPHIWLSIKNSLIMIENIYKALIMIDPTHQDRYQQNLNKAKDKLTKCHDRLKRILKSKKSKTFMVFHPAFTYFAKDFNLTQLSIEVDGKEPTIKELITTIKNAKTKDIGSIITSPEFSDKSAKTIASELGITIKKISPLNPDICKTLTGVADSIR